MSEIDKIASIFKDDLRRREIEEAKRLDDMILNEQLKIYTSSSNSIMRYSNLILVAGYAAFFTVWSKEFKGVPENLILLSGTLIIISLLTFFISEIIKIIKELNFDESQLSILNSDESSKKEKLSQLGENYDKYFAKHSKWGKRRFYVAFLQGY